MQRNDSWRTQTLELKSPSPCRGSNCWFTALRLYHWATPIHYKKLSLNYAFILHRWKIMVFATIFGMSLFGCVNSSCRGHWVLQNNDVLGFGQPFGTQIPWFSFLRDGTTLDWIDLSTLYGMRMPQSQAASHQEWLSVRSLIIRHRQQQGWSGTEGTAPLCKRHYFSCQIFRW